MWTKMQPACGAPVYGGVADVSVEPQSQARPAAPREALDGVSRRRMAELARAHRPALEAVARRLCCGGPEAEDLVQDALERAVRNADKLSDPARARAWLVTVLHNLFIDRCRRKSRRPHHDALDEDRHGATPEEVTTASWSELGADDLRAAVAALPEEFRLPYEMHALHRASYDDIARALGIPRNTVGTRLFRARRKLRQILSERCGEEAP